VLMYSSSCAVTVAEAFDTSDVLMFQFSARYLLIRCLNALYVQIAVLVEQKFDLFVVRALEREQVSF
jgi:hypothetical protein